MTGIAPARPWSTNRRIRQAPQAPDAAGSSDDTVRLALLGQLLRRRWRQLAAFAVVGALLGALAGLLLSPGYQTSTSVLLQGPRDPAELLTEAQVAMSAVVLDRTAAGLGWDVTGADLKDDVQAKVADGNVIQITGTADSPERAQQLTDRVAQEYVRFWTQLVNETADASAQALQEQRNALREQITGTNDKIAELHASAQGLTIDNVRLRTELEGLRTSLSEAMKKLDEVDAASSAANMVIMGQSERPTARAGLGLPVTTAGGAMLFLLLGVFAHLFAARSDRRLRTEPEIAAALGAPLLGSVDVPEDPSGSGQQAGPTPLLTRLRRLAWDDRPWDVPPLQPSGDDFSRAVRYRRVLARLPAGTHPQAFMVLAAGDDPMAMQAVRQLTVAAHTDGTMRSMLRPAIIEPARPTVPDDRTAAGAVLVVTTGTRTAWELVGITEACADAGQSVAGAVVVHPTRLPGDGGRPNGPGPAARVGGPMAGAP